VHRLLALLPAAFLLAACGGGGGGSSTAAAKGGAVVKTIQISEKEFSLTPSSAKLSQTGTYEFQVSNAGTITHAFEIEGNGVEEKTGDIAPGASKTLRVTLSAEGSYEMYCPIDGHKGQGMKGTITVGKAAGSGGMTTTGQTTTDQAPGY
jgi:uncharacterized cupredoxin-like copper-binding protein